MAYLVRPVGSSERFSLGTYQYRELSPAMIPAFRKKRYGAGIL
jgi:hypothetical protein